MQNPDKCQIRLVLIMGEIISVEVRIHHMKPQVGATGMALLESL